MSLPLCIETKPVRQGRREASDGRGVGHRSEPITSAQLEWMPATSVAANRRLSGLFHETDTHRLVRPRSASANGYRAEPAAQKSITAAGTLRRSGRNSAEVFHHAATASSA